MMQKPSGQVVQGAVSFSILLNLYILCVFDFTQRF